MRQIVCFPETQTQGYNVDIARADTVGKQEYAPAGAMKR
jgi:hypothetical protein